jgi:hypothetical protein
MYSEDQPIYIHADHRLSEISSFHGSGCEDSELQAQHCFRGLMPSYSGWEIKAECCF